MCPLAFFLFFPFLSISHSLCVSALPVALLPFVASDRRTGLHLRAELSSAPADTVDLHHLFSHVAFALRAARSPPLRDVGTRGRAPTGGCAGSARIRTLVGGLMGHSDTGWTAHRVLECEILHRGGRMVGEGGRRGGGIRIVLPRKGEVSGLGRGQEVSRRLELGI